MEREAALPKNIRQIGEIDGRERVCIEDYVMTCIHKKEQQEEKGYLGIFLGERRESEEGLPYVFIRGIFEVPQEIQDSETLQRAYRHYFGDWEVQGCCVIGVYPTERMKLLATRIPESGRLIYHLQEQEETLYRTGPDGYERLRGYFVFYEQNRKMQFYLSEIFSEDSVEKEGAPEKAVRSFREKVKEKSEKKRGSVLRMASSFFVITVLIIGAIVVNRIEDIRLAHGLSGQAETSAGTERAETEPEVLHLTAGDLSGYRTTSGTAQYDAAQRAAEETVLPGSDAFWAETALEDEEETDADTLQTTSGAGTADTDVDTVDAAAGTVNADTGADTVDMTAGITGSDSGAAVQAGAVAGITGSDSGTATPTTSEASSLQTASGTGTADTDAGTVNAAAGTVNADTATGAADTAAGIPGSGNGTDASSADEASSLQATSGTGTAAADAGTADTNADAETAAPAAGISGADGGAAPSADSPEALEASARHTQAGYVIKEGDTLAKICSRYYGTIERVEEVCKANGIKDANVILPGQRIVLP